MLKFVSSHGLSASRLGGARTQKLFTLHQQKLSQYLYPLQGLLFSESKRCKTSVHKPNLSSSRPIASMAQSTCCGANAAPPVSVDYTPKGKSVQLNDLPVYTVGEGKEGLIFMFDIFGSGYKQIYQVADRLASAGFTVAIPDLFRGNGWSLAKFPPKPEDDFMGWLSREGTWEKCGADFRAVKEHLSSQGVTKVGTVGMCWGAKMALEANAEGMVAAAAICHPALFGAERALAERAQAPVAILPAGGDPMDELKEVLDKKPFASKCMYKRFDDQVHGFMAARGDWTKPEVASAASQGIELLKQFFTATLKA